MSNAQDLPELLALHREHRDQFDYFHVGTFWSNFKKLPRGQLGGLSDRLAPVCEQTVLMLPELNARALANLAHAFAKTGLVGTGPWQNVWAGLPEAIRRLIRGFDPQTLSNTAWAFAKADYLSTELFNVILAEVVRRELSNFNPQDLSNTAWAFAMLIPRWACKSTDRCASGYFSGLLWGNVRVRARVWGVWYAGFRCVYVCGCAYEL